ncbi:MULTISPECIES: nitrate reductase molybdenum cofactor assembly chaperone [Bacillaceae]|uniref:nitrate reductase molybdenum cofactor assembly chaperone n=1 Tax=Bacillaceae TaxID=186817 RepID=UPI001189C9C9|nr:nitrate reductase molybdenum cofactor assembly chaperone [Bacillus sp. S3]QCJ43079.1 nitrate reductase molybdenum cofactor assembly chaperone [Bacillus sp. S3]
MDEYQQIFRLSSTLLQHPEEAWFEDEGLKSEISAIENQLVKLLFRQFFHHLQSASYLEICSQYAQTFDFSDKTTLYLTYPIFGENPDRGKALVKLKNEYFEAGFPLESDELPDYLPLILEFCSIAPIESAQKMLQIHRKSIDQLLKELSLLDSPYQMILQACVQTIDNILSKQKAS